MAVLAMNKYSKEANNDGSDKPFRMQKLNILWNQAYQKLEKRELSQLMEDLKHQDISEIELKKIKAENRDPDGKTEAQVRRQLRMILNKYGLEMDSKFKDDSTTPSTVDNKQVFSDKKLEDLWKKVHQLNLNEQELAILKEEVKSFENELHYYHRLINQYYDKRENRLHANDKEFFDNHIDPVNFTETLIEEINEKIQQKHSELKDKLKRIRDKVYDKDFKLEGELDEIQATRLWHLALKSEFNAEELVELKQRLLHYQNFVKKLNYFSGQLQAHNLNKQNQDVDEMDEDSSRKNLHKHIENRMKELDGYVKKLHQQLEEKIRNKHSEL
ncbi:alpha-2-macroglobulin receptor-associated protein-like protein [Euroglyphus maynei]|uniref:Alpha-2-macroglobulin receptor-associated protein-like protein n=1 Tax=Euroglyphus maynei TaxID=6958 RepID=A0A1Y3ARE5_EURMA|nr:alpha-2-macroglobulin receptor-associated protein-like protein [Euroglyphus maynei]